MRRSWVWVAMFLVGCVEDPVHGDPGESWSVTLALAEDVAGGWTAEAPGQLFFAYGDGAPSSEQVMCRDAEPVVLTGGGIGCGNEVAVEAWIEPARLEVDRFGEAVTCGVASHPSDPADPIKRPDDAPYGRALLFAGIEDCDGGEDAITLEIALP